MKNLIDFSSLTMDSLHITTQNLDIWNYSKISKHFNLEISLEVKSSDDQKKKIRKKLQKVLETGIEQFLKSDKTDKSTKEFILWLNSFCNNFTNFSTFDKLLTNSKLIIVKNNISLLKKLLKF